MLSCKVRNDPALMSAASPGEVTQLSTDYSQHTVILVCADLIHMPFDNNLSLLTFSYLDSTCSPRLLNTPNLGDILIVYYILTKGTLVISKMVAKAGK